MCNSALILAPGGDSENGDTAKSSPRRTLQSQLSRCEDEDGEKARSLAADSMSPVHVSYHLPVRAREEEFLRAFPF